MAEQERSGGGRARGAARARAFGRKKTAGPNGSSQGGSTSRREREKSTVGAGFGRRAATQAHMTLGRLPMPTQAHGGAFGALGGAWTGRHQGCMRSARPVRDRDSSAPGQRRGVRSQSSAVRSCQACTASLESAKRRGGVFCETQRRRRMRGGQLGSATVPRQLSASGGDGHKIIDSPAGCASPCFCLGKGPCRRVHDDDGPNSRLLGGLGRRGRARPPEMAWPSSSGTLRNHPRSCTGRVVLAWFRGCRPHPRPAASTSTSTSTVRAEKGFRVQSWTCGGTDPWLVPRNRHSPALADSANRAFLPVSIILLGRREPGCIRYRRRRLLTLPAAPCWKKGGLEESTHAQYMVGI